MIKYAPAPTQRQQAVPATAEDISAKRRMALSLMQQGSDASPVGHWTQALARAVQGGIGGLTAAGASRDATAREAYDTQQSAAQRIAAGEQEFQNKKRWDEYQRGRELTEAEKLDMEYKRAQAEKLRRDATNGGELPSNVREWDHFNKLTPEDQQRYLTMKRAEKYLDLGDRYSQPNPAVPGQTVREIPKNVAEEARQKKVGNEIGDRQMAQPKAQASLAAIDAKSDIVLKTIGEARQMVGPYTAGFGGAALSNLPGTAARDLSAKLDTLKANAGFAELQTMRDNSPTGGALGQVAVQELAMLQATVTSLEQAQTPEQLSRALDAYEAFIRESKVRRKQAYEATYGGAQPMMQPSTVPASDGWTDVGGVRIREKR